MSHLLSTVLVLAAEVWQPGGLLQAQLLQELKGLRTVAWYSAYACQAEPCFMPASALQSHKLKQLVRCRCSMAHLNVEPTRRRNRSTLERPVWCQQTLLSDESLLCGV